MLKLKLCCYWYICRIVHSHDIICDGSLGIRDNEKFIAIAVNVYTSKKTVQYFLAIGKQLRNVSLDLRHISCKRA